MINKEQAEYLILILYTVSLADNEFHEEEENYIISIGTKYGIEKDRISFIIKNPHKIFQRDPENDDEKLLFAYSMCELLYSDGKIDPREVNSLRKFMELMGLTQVDELSSIMIDSVINNIEFEAFLN